MTHPSDPGHPPRSEAPGNPAGAYGPPPGSRQGRPGDVPGPRPTRPAAQARPGYGGPGGTAPDRQEPVPPKRGRQGLLGVLLDADFNSLVTPSLIRTIYVLALLVVSLECLAVLVLGLWITIGTAYWVTGIVVVLATPLIWLFQMLLTRVLMEAVVVRFKQAEYLRIIKDKL